MSKHISSCGLCNWQKLVCAGTRIQILRNFAVRSGDTPDLPDYNTDVNIHEHKLKRPKPASERPSWKGLRNLEKRTEGSLIPDTLKTIEGDEEFKTTLEKLKKFGQKKLTREERTRRRRALDKFGIPNFNRFLQEKKKEFGVEDGKTHLGKNAINVLQLNIGVYCNQACNHCHVESSPKRKEMMNRDVADKCLEVLSKSPLIQTVDITGGAPELCSEFRYIAKKVRDMKLHSIDRCNLTVLSEPGQEDLGEFLADNGIHVIASLPCYSSKNVDMQRGKGVFDRSIRGLLLLNSMGYGRPGSGLQLDLVYNAAGAYLPPPQEELEAHYKKELMGTFGIEFNKLYTMTNMPIKRFADFLHRRNELEEYMSILLRNFNINTIDNLMCVNHLSVNWNGTLSDCDFNQQLALGIKDKKDGKDLSIFDIESTEELHNYPVMLDNHCFGCTAGMGSS